MRTSSQAAALLLAAGLLGACSSSAFDSQPIDPTSTSEAAEPATDGDGGRSTEPDDGMETATVEVGTRFEEPDLEAGPADGEIPEDQAEEPVDEPDQTDPDDTEDVAQVGLGRGESALCATVQIGLDAINDGASERAAAQQRLLLDRSELAEDGALAAIIDTIDDEEPVEVDVLDEALDRCEDLGFEP